MDSDKVVPVQSVRRALEALDRLALAGLRGEAVSLQQVAEHLGVAATTAHNIIKTLATCGYVQREERGYGLGPRCADLARSARFGGGWLERAAAVVHQLAERTGESVVLATLLH
ncbi:MAG: helix-turn-helix domain-containing protein, partial [Armatimonadetes bacterium]|nr:helix-turn-helix domain-containing protein [Armatimonadota bacterium]